MLERWEAFMGPIIRHAGMRRRGMLHHAYLFEDKGMREDALLSFNNHRAF